MSVPDKTTLARSMLVIEFVAEIIHKSRRTVLFVEASSHYKICSYCADLLRLPGVLWTENLTPETFTRWAGVIHEKSPQDDLNNHLQRSFLDFFGRKLVERGFATSNPARIARQRAKAEAAVESIPTTPEPPPANGQAIPLEDFAAKLLTIYNEDLRATPTRQKLRQALEDFGRMAGVRTTADLTHENIARWVRGKIDRGDRRETIVGLLSALRAACNKAVHWQYLGADPIGKPTEWLPHGYEGRPKPAGPEALNDDQVERLMAHLLDASTTWEGHRLFVLVATLVYAGLRKMEALKLEWDRCDLDSRNLVIPRVSPEKRNRPIPSQLATILAEWKAVCESSFVFPGAKLRGPWTDGSPQNKALTCIKRAGQAVGIHDLSFERIRAYREKRDKPIRLPTFEGQTAPDRNHTGPSPTRPGRKPRNPLIVLSWSPDRRVIVRGEPMDAILTPAEFNILKAMIDFGCLEGGRIRSDELGTRSGHPGPDRTLRDLKKKIPRLKTLLIGGRGGYGFVSE